MSLARVACVIPARDVADRIQATVIAARALPGVDVVIVTDDGSSDPTGDYAAASGAIVVTHQRGRGRAAAIESGVNALGVLEQRDKRPECGTVLVLDADLGASAARAQHLIGPVVTERADLTIAIPPRPARGAGPRLRPGRDHRRPRCHRAGRLDPAGSAGHEPLPDPARVRARQSAGRRRRSRCRDDHRPAAGRAAGAGDRDRRRWWRPAGRVWPPGWTERWC